MEIKQLTKMLEDKITERLSELNIKGKNFKKLIKDHEQLQQKHSLEMAEIVLELEPVLYMVRQQHPHMNELFDTLLKLHNDHKQNRESKNK